MKLKINKLKNNNNNFLKKCLLVINDIHLAIPITWVGTQPHSNP